MTKNEFSLAFNEVLDEKQLPKDVILGALESAMVSAYRKAVMASTSQTINAKVDPETGLVIIYAEKEVVEEVLEDKTEVTLAEARKVNPEAQLGDLVIVESTPKDFGRVAAQNARQTIQQKIREAERSAQMAHYQQQIGEIISGIVQTSSPQQGVTIALDMKAEGVLPNNQKIPGERIRQHDRVRAIVLEVKESNRGPQIILSRGHGNFLRRLLENEVPEIYHGIVEIRAIAREPGQRAKVAVSATQQGVDPVGACVGVRGVRIQAIVKELHDEKIDIIEWNPDPIAYISKAISPARVTGVYLNDSGENGKTATVVVQEDQLSLAIGRDGQNARLAAKLTKWRIDIKSIVEAAGDALSKLQNDPSFAEQATREAQAVTHVEEILAKKAENRPVTPEEYSVLSSFIDRVERGNMDQILAAKAADDEATAEARAGIPATAFKQPLDALGLPDHVYAILTEAEYLTAGDLILAMKLTPDKVLKLAGIGPKAMLAIEKAVSETHFAEEPVAVEEEPLPTAAITEPVAEADTAALPVEPEEEKSFEEMFQAATIARPLPGSIIEDDDKKDKKDKKKKGIVYERNEDSGEVVGKKKHKRGDADFGTEEW